MSARRAHENWTHSNPVRISFGAGCRRVLAELVAGKRVLAVSTAGGRRRAQNDDRLASALSTSGSAQSVEWVDTVTENPSLRALQSVADGLEADRYDVIVGLGGGSAIDSAKVFSAATAGNALGLDIRQMIADPAAWSPHPVVPMVAVPTTSGTGSEVTPFATVWDEAAQKKLSLSDDALFPSHALVDPELASTLPTDVTLSTGLDAVNQAAESLWNKRATPISTSIAVRAVVLGMQALPVLTKTGGGLDERSMMAEASVLAGLAISQTRTSICHSISYPITAHFGVSHGLACAFTMGAAAELFDGVGHAPLDDLARELGTAPGEGGLSAVIGRWLTDLDVGARVRAQVPDLESLLALVGEMFTPGRADNAPVSIGASEIERILTDSWGR